MRVGMTRDKSFFPSPTSSFSQVARLSPITAPLDPDYTTIKGHRVGNAKNTVPIHHLPPGASLDPGGTSPHQLPFKVDPNITSERSKFVVGGRRDVGLGARAGIEQEQEGTRQATGSQANLHLMEVLACKAIIDLPEL